MCAGTNASPRPRSTTSQRGCWRLCQRCGAATSCQCFFFLLPIIWPIASSSCMQAPVPVPDHAQSQVSQATGGYVSIVVLPRHIKNDTLDDFAWRLLSFHDHVQYHVKCFQVQSQRLLIHVKDETLDHFACRLLSFHDHVQCRDKCFQMPRVTHLSNLQLLCML